MFEIIFLIILCLYFTINVYIIAGIKRKFPRLNQDEYPFVSVIVAARNEERNIIPCMESLSRLVYPNGKLEIIIVDDESEDKTGELIDNFIEGKENFRRISTRGSHGKLKGKVNALHKGISAAKGEVIMLTDADCVVGPQWAASIASAYMPNTGIVNGYTTQKVFDAFSGMQAVDFVYLLGVAAGTINNNKPVSCIGNNMSFRKQAYLDVGGYEALPFSVTEDSALLLQIHKLGKYEIIHPFSKEALVISEPCFDLTTLYRQKKRWAVGGMDVSPAGKFIMSMAWLGNMFVLLTPLFFSMVSLYLAVFKIAVDAFFLVPLHNDLGLKRNLRFFLVFELYFILYTTALPFILLFSRKVKWKGRNY